MPNEDLPWIASGYYLKKTRVAVDNTQWFPLVPSNPSRWHIFFFITTPNACQVTWDRGSTIGEGLFIGNEDSPVEWKFRDSPVLTTAAWFGSSLGFIATTIEIWETLPVGA